MTSIVAKFIEALILRRLEHLLEGSLDPNQSGFVPGRTTDENIAILANAASETRQDFEKCGVLLFFGISGAFDNVSHRIYSRKTYPAVSQTICTMVSGLPFEPFSAASLWKNILEEYWL